MALKTLPGLEEHEDTTKAMVKLAMSIGQKKHGSAEPILQQVLAVRRRVHGAHHEDTVDAMERLADVFSQQSKFSYAEPLYREVRGQKREAG